MKILKIEARNFKPFHNISIPSDGYFKEGFFLIKGKNSMGKTSFIEAILWGILGEQLMAEKDRKILIKNGELKCEVIVTFEISEVQYRVIRTMEVVKKKVQKNETNYIINNTIKSSALLFRQERVNNDNKYKFVQICRGTSTVNREIESLLGIYPESIEKTIYIRQKEVDKLALADPSELRDLIKNLFGLEEFDFKIKNYLRKKVNKLNQDINNLNTQIGNLMIERNELEKQNNISKDKQEKLLLKQKELLHDENVLATYPKKELLLEIKKNIEIINKNQDNLNYIEKITDREKENLSVQKNRIKELQDKIFNLNITINRLLEEIQKYPKISNIKNARDILQNIENDEKHIKNLVLQSELSSFDFQNISIDNLQDIKREIKKNDEDIKNLRNEKDKNIKLLDEHKHLLNTNQILSDIKKNSMEYISNNNTCPICSNVIDNNSILVTNIRREIHSISRKENVVKTDIDIIEKQLQKIEKQLDNKKNIKQALEFLIPIISGMIEKRFHFYDELNSVIELSQCNYGTSKSTYKIIDDLFSKIMKKENEIFTSRELVKNFEDKLRSENINLKRLMNEINNLFSQQNQAKLQIESANKFLIEHYKNLKIVNLEDLLNPFLCQNIDELISKRTDLAIHIKEKSNLIEIIKEDVSFLRNEINLRIKRINNLLQSEEELEEKENALRHILFLIGEIDGFISNDIVEGKLASVLMRSTNYYLVPFTEGRYKIANVSSTMRKIKDKISHGLTMTLLDDKDGVQKSKEQLSGGDESALGLALRIAISKLMSTIRPFKYIEKKIPMINFIILDEPLTSLDEARRNIIMNILINDKSFKQIFLISHTEIEGNNYHSIIINDDENSQRQILYNHQ
ncbi:MAG: AAA family ATPase [Nitrososphaerales archaeon]